MAVNQFADLPLGLILQIAFSDGIRNQISTDFRDYEMVKRAKVGNSLARELRFMFQSSLGPAAIQYSDLSTPSREFPGSQNISITEYTARLKEMNATIELDYSVFDRARKNPEKYAEPLAVEIDSKMSAAKRQLAKDLYGDGTGVIGTIASAAVPSPLPVGNADVVFTLSTSGSARGHVGFFEYGDLLALKSASGAASALVVKDNNGTPATTAVSYWRVEEKDRENNKVVLRALNSSLSPVAPINPATTPVAAVTTQPTAGDVFYRIGQSTIPNLSGSLGDYGTLTQVIAGLGSLVANDGRQIHGITMSGVTAGTHYDAGGNPLDVKHVQKLMDKVKLAVGQDRYRWKMLTMAPESHATLIESRETDRRFQTVEDNKRGVKFFAYVHGNDVLECVTSEYVPQNTIYCLPETKAGEKVLEFHGSDFETVKGQDMSDFHLKVSSGAYRNAMVSYLQASGVLICKHPSSVGVIKNFTNS
jgi:hypothetical protein